eukprot:2526601-Alexandrium_andersonii.AAC.1
MLYRCPVVLCITKAKGSEAAKTLGAASGMLPAERLRGLPVRPPVLPAPPDETVMLAVGEFVPGVYFIDGSGGPRAATPSIRRAAS